MKKIWNAVLTITFFGFCLAEAASPVGVGTWGVGAEIGGESSISVQNSYSSEGSIVIGVGSAQDEMNVHADHLWYLGSRLDIHPYAGLGAGVAEGDKLSDNNDVVAQIRVPVGISYYTPQAPLNIFGQILPIFDVGERSEWYAQIGMRYLVE